ncbi:MOSC domain-containing protein [Microvirga roseola]|uniref:MOSC domain-containing protein n=1 Tax=Microvirga roseola TaxID=2883126 RepID=UPI001E592E05|nr:MOSC domain-containing protein [Microvirga roseola]
MNAIVTAVSSSGTHRFSKANRDRIRLLAGLGIEGDAHLGTTVKHRSRVAKDPSQPNLRQVHLIHSELFDDLQAKGFSVRAGEMGENVTTRGIDLLGRSTGARLLIGTAAVIEVTGLRNPCVQIDRFQKGPMQAVLDGDAEGNVIRKSGVMAIVIEGGEIRPGDSIRVEHPPGPYRPLECV